MKKIIITSLGLIFAIVLGGLGWIYFQPKNEGIQVVDTSSPTTATTSQLTYISATTSTSSVPTPIIKVTVSKPLAIQGKSEIDKYGVQLYTLKQGVTTVKKLISGKNATITYTRNKDEIERKVSIVHPDGGVETLRDTINLDSKEILLGMIKEMETNFSRDCSNISTKECVDGKKVLDYLKIRCVTLIKNEEISACAFEAITGAFGN